MRYGPQSRIVCSPLLYTLQAIFGIVRIFTPISKEQKTHLDICGVFPEHFAPNYVAEVHCCCLA
jgi:hypothetical protein